MQEVWFIAGPTNLYQEYGKFFYDNNIEIKIFCGRINILETKMVYINESNIDVIGKILEILNSYNDMDFMPRFKLSKPNEDECVYYNEYMKNYDVVLEEGCDCNMLYQYGLLENPKPIKCFMRNGKYYGDYDLINNKIILTEEEINEINKIYMEDYNNGPNCGGDVLDFF
jgi:hypothetical protein